AFGEAGYDVQRATDAAFSANVVDFPLVKKGSNTFVDDGTVSPLDAATKYYYRVRTTGTTTWVTAGSAQLNDINLFGTDVPLTGFNQSNSTVNGFATNTLAGPVTLTEEQNDRSGSVFYNRAFNINTDFTTQFDIRMTAGSGADGMA